MGLPQSRGPIALQVFVLTHDSRFGLRQLEPIMLYMGRSGGGLPRDGDGRGGVAEYFWMFGVDQCRVCGTPITVSSRAAREEQEKANRRPLMPEAEWRRRGYLCPPTKKQLNIAPAGGCCMKCGEKQARQFYQARLRLAGMVALSLGLILSAIALLTYMSH
jgi:hypothetical protein